MNKDDYRDKIMFRDAPPSSFGYARDHRQQETLAENALWERLKNKQLQGLKWRRQHPFGGFILDFYCHSWRKSSRLAQKKLFQKTLKILTDNWKTPKSSPPAFRGRG